MSDEEQWRNAVINDFKSVWEQIDMQRGMVIICYLMSFAALILAVVK